MMNQAWPGGLLLGIATATGCLLTEPTERQPGEVRTGIYDVELATHTDTCSPRRGEGPLGRHDVSADFYGISLWTASGIPGAGHSFLRYELPSADDYQATRGRGLLIGRDCGGEASFLQLNELVAANESGFVVRQRTDWTVARPCLDPVLSELPLQSCRVDQDYLYVLRQVCEEPCRVTRVGEEITCTCL